MMHTLWHWLLYWLAWASADPGLVFTVSRKRCSTGSTTKGNGAVPTPGVNPWNEKQDPAAGSA